MITWLFDRKNQYGYIPNLVKNTTLIPKTKEWYDLATQKPYSQEFRFLKYCQLDNVSFRTALVNEQWSTPAYYPINLNIYDPDLDYFELMDDESYCRFINREFKVLFYYSEGDDPDVDIIPSMNKWMKKHNITWDYIKFVTANWLAQDSSFLFFPDHEVYYRYLHLCEKTPQWITNINFEKRQKKSTCLMRADKLWRRIFASQCIKLGLDQNSFFSYNNYQYETPMIDNGIDINRWNKTFETLENDLLLLGMRLPIECDDLSNDQRNNHKLIDRRYFDQSYWHIVVETHFDQHCCFLTEKTFKPILNLQPFVIVGNPHSLELLRSLGYRTFHDVMNEMYDDMTNPQTRLNTLLYTYMSINSISDHHHCLIQRKIHDTLVHNQKNFLASKKLRIQELLDQLEK